MANRDGHKIDVFRLALMRSDYETQGLSYEQLSFKYKENITTIKKYAVAEKWKHLVKPQRNQKGFERVYDSALKNKREATIQKKIDILAGMTSTEFVEKWGCSMSSYYTTRRNVRNIQLERSEALMNDIAVKCFKDAEERLIKIQEKKRLLEIEILENDLDKKEVELIKSKLEALQKLEQDIKYNARVISDSKQAYLEGELVKENLTKKRIDIEEERLKLEKAKNEREGQQKEAEIVTMLRNLTSSRE